MHDYRIVILYIEIASNKTINSYCQWEAQCTNVFIKMAVSATMSNYHHQMHHSSSSHQQTSHHHSHQSQQQHSRCFICGSRIGRGNQTSLRMEEKMDKLISVSQTVEHSSTIISDILSRILNETVSSFSIIVLKWLQ